MARRRGGRGFGACGLYDAYLEPPSDLWAEDLLERTTEPTEPPPPDSKPTPKAAPPAVPPRRRP